MVAVYNPINLNVRAECSRHGQTHRTPRPTQDLQNVLFYKRRPEFKNNFKSMTDD